MKIINLIAFCVLAGIVGGCSSDPNPGQLMQVIMLQVDPQKFSVKELKIISNDTIRTSEGEAHVSRIKAEIETIEPLFSIDIQTDHTILISPRAQKGQVILGYFVVTSTAYKEDFRHDVKIEDFKDPGITSSQAMGSAGTRAVIRSDSEAGRYYLEQSRMQSKLLNGATSKNIIDIETADGNVYSAAFPVTRDWSPWISVYFSEYMREKNTSWTNCSAGVKFQLKSKFAFNEYTIGGDDGASNLALLFRDDKSRNAYSKMLRVRSDDSNQWCRVCLLRSKFVENNYGCKRFAGEEIGEVPDGEEVYRQLDLTQEIR